MVLRFEKIHVDLYTYLKTALQMHSQYDNDHKPLQK